MTREPRASRRSIAWALGRALRGRLQDKLAGKVASDAVDLLIARLESGGAHMQTL